MRPAALALLAVAFAAAPARAAPPGEKSDPKFAARALAEHGHALREAGRHQEAIEVLQQAERLYHAPTIVIEIARAHAAIGKLVQARALYRRVVDERLGPEAPRAFKDAQRAAADELPAIEKRIPEVRILVRGGGGRGLRVSIDEAEIADWSPERFVSADPGARRIAAVPLGGVGVTRTVELAEGARAIVEIELAGAAPVIVRPAPAPPPPKPPPAPWRVPSYVCFGVGAAGLALGIGAGVVTLNKAAELRAACPTGTCPTTAHDAEIDAANGMGIASTAGFVLAGAGAAVGAALLFVRPSGKAAPRITVGPGQLRLEGGF